MLTDAEKLRITSDILEGTEFKDSKRYQELLNYLVRETLAGKAPKEVTIGTEFFRKGSSFDPKEDPTVRVYLNNLRKKLEHYYLSTEAKPEYRLEIPRGHYQVEFVKIEVPPPPVTAPHVKKWRLPALLLLIVVLLSVTIIVLVNRGTTTETLSANPIWSEYLSPGSRPTLVVLGDFYFLYERKPDSTTGNFVRNIYINSPDDFKEMVKRDPSFSAHFLQSDFTFLRPSASWGLTQILPIVQQSPGGYALKLASQFTVEDLESQNIVYIGSFKTLYNLNKFLHIFGLKYSFSPSRLEVLGNPPDSTRRYSPQGVRGGNYEKDFAVVAKATGPSGSTILLLLGFADSGVIEATQAVSKPQMIAAITKDLAHDAEMKPFNFTLVVETEGINQAVFKSAIQHFVRR